MIYESLVEASANDNDIGFASAGPKEPSNQTKVVVATVFLSFPFLYILLLLETVQQITLLLIPLLLLLVLILLLHFLSMGTV